MNTKYFSLDMINIDNIIVVGDRVLLKPEDNLQKTTSGLYLPPGVVEKEKVQGGYIVKVGPGYPVASGTEDDEPWRENRVTKYIPLQAKPGDFALYLKKDSIDIEFQKERLVIVPQAAILLLHREDLLDF
jgi:co-chaperonin GroES (HSP10)